MKKPDLEFHFDGQQSEADAQALADFFADVSFSLLLKSRT